MLNIASLAARSEIYGPGTRFVIWVQGCALRCPGCWNQDTWSFESRHMVDPEELARRVLHEVGLEGVTLLGGEPMHQAGELLTLVRAVRDRGLTVMTYTGYEVEELRSSAQRQLVAQSDIVVAGRFVQAQRDTGLRWRGSRNQRILFPTGRYRSLDQVEANEAEVVIDSSGAVSVRGYPEPWLWEAISGE